jgi:formylglycine-generating enzyme required for sulfatase activity
MRTSLMLLAVIVLPAWAWGQAAPNEPAGASAKVFGRYVEEVPKYSVKIEMVPVSGGKFVMAPVEKEGKPAEVGVKDFWMAKTELTWDSFDSFRKGEDLTQEEQEKIDQSGRWRTRPDRPEENPDRGYGHQGFAVISVTYETARVYCEWLSKHTGRKYRLPTEAEFEYAARAGRAEPLTEDGLLREAWLAENAWTDEAPDGTPHPVGRRAANPWGLHDLLGNVAEWTIPPAGVDPPAARGGSFKSSVKRVGYGYRQPMSARWQARDAMEPKSRWWLTDGDMIGFRVVRVRE